MLRASKWLPSIKKHLNTTCLGLEIEVDIPMMPSVTDAKAGSAHGLADILEHYNQDVDELIRGRIIDPISGTKLVKNSCLCNFKLFLFRTSPWIQSEFEFDRGALDCDRSKKDAMSRRTRVLAERSAEGCQGRRQIVCISEQNQVRFDWSSDISVNYNGILVLFRKLISAGISAHDDHLKNAKLRDVRNMQLKLADRTFKPNSVTPEVPNTEFRRALVDAHEKDENLFEKEYFKTLHFNAHLLFRTRIKNLCDGTVSNCFDFTSFSQPRPLSQSIQKFITNLTRPFCQFVFSTIDLLTWTRI